MTAKADIVYALGTGSIWNNNEIRYSLRSVEKHLSNYGNVFIVGVLPDFLQSVIHIPYSDNSVDKETNIYKKVLRACQEPDISEDFLFINDDHFLNSDFTLPDFPYYYKGEMIASVQKLADNNKYKRNLDKTMRTLHALGYLTRNFDTHTPIIYNKKAFIDTMSRYPWGNGLGYTVKSLYCNTLRIEGIREADCKIGRNIQDWTEDRIMDTIRDAKCWSVTNFISPAIEAVLNKLYPTKSCYEQ